MLKNHTSVIEHPTVQNAAPSFRRRIGLWALGAAVAPLVGCFAPTLSEDAIANGDTRTLTIYHTHTHETTTASFRVNGRYSAAALEQLNWALRDWRRNEPTKIDPRLFDVAWEVQREVGSTQPIQIVSAFRSPETNAMLRRRSGAVAEYSQHMLGKAMDVHLTDVSMASVRAVAMRLQRGGVGYYPTAGSPFVHMDVGSVRYWPRMSRQELSRIFPDGKTVDLPADGQPMPRYQEALAEIQARGGSAEEPAESGGGKNIFAMLFGGGGSGEDEPRPAASAVTAAPPERSGRGRTARVASLQAAAPATVERPTEAALTEAAAALKVTAEASSDVKNVVPVPVARPRVLAENGVTASDATAIPVPAPRPAEFTAARDVPMPTPRPAELGAAVAAIVQATPPQAITQASRPARLQAPSPAMAFAQADANVPAAVMAIVQQQPADTRARKPDPVAAIKNDGKLNVVAMPSSRARARMALPSVITRGPDQPAVANPALAFASASGQVGAGQVGAGQVAAGQVAAKQDTLPAAAKVAIVLRRTPPLRKPEFVPARVDRSNFRTLTASALTERVTSYSAQGGGSSLAPMRAAARLNPRSATGMASSGVVGHFCDHPNGDLKAGRFSGPAVKALAFEDGFATLSTDR